MPAFAEDKAVRGINGVTEHADEGDVDFSKHPSGELDNTYKGSDEPGEHECKESKDDAPYESQDDRQGDGKDVVHDVLRVVVDGTSDFQHDWDGFCALGLDENFFKLNLCNSHTSVDPIPHFCRPYSPTLL